jgi:hypothetical protein
VSILRAQQYRASSQPIGASVPTQLSDSLRAGPLGAINARVLARLHAELRATPGRDQWMVVVPGESEHWGHHRAPPREEEARGVRIGMEFQLRLERAFRLLERDIVRYVLISGGSIDASRPDYNESHRGREVMLARYGRHFRDGALEDRILLDPEAHHSTTNLRNAAKLCVELGIDRMLIATTMPPTPLLWPVLVPVLYQTSQGWYFLHHRVSTFDWRCRRELGYTLGTFEWFEHGEGRERITAIALKTLPADRLKADQFGP